MQDGKRIKLFARCSLLAPRYPQEAAESRRGFTPVSQWAEIAYKVSNSGEEAEEEHQAKEKQKSSEMQPCFLAAAVEQNREAKRKDWRGISGREVIRGAFGEVFCIVFCSALCC